MRAVITVVGKDQVGIIYKVSGVLADNGVNILEISQTLMQDLFTMIMLVDVSGCKIAFSDLADRLKELGESLCLSIRIQHEDLFNSMHRI